MECCANPYGKGQCLEISAGGKVSLERSDVIKVSKLHVSPVDKVFTIVQPSVVSPPSDYIV